MTPLVLASHLGSSNCLQLLVSNLDLSKAPTQDSYGRNAVLSAVHSRSLETFRLVGHKIGFEGYDNDGNSCLNLAAAEGSLEIVQFCIEELQHTIHKNLHGQTALHLASTPEVIEYLVLQGAGIDDQDNYGWTPLHQAVYNGSPECVRLFLQMGAKLDVLDSNFNTCFDYAVKLKDQSILEMLRDELRHKVRSQIFDQSAPEESLAFIESSDIIQEVNSESDGEKVHLKNSSETVKHSPASPSLRKALSSVFFKYPSMEVENLTDFGVEIIKLEELYLREQLGRGGYGHVYRGYYRSGEVAVKILTENRVNERIVSEFIKEIQCLVKIRHHRFLLLIGVCIEGPLCIVTELAKGGNLADSINSGLLTEEDKLRIASQIAEGMAFIHSKNPPIVHRDLKPQNILLDSFLQVKIGDLGLSRTIQQCAQSFKLESTQVCAGTVRYMAPELYEEEPICTIESDIWAFGCVLFQLFTGLEPWSGLELTAVQRRLVLRYPFEMPQSFFQPVKELIQSCCNLDRKQRPSFKAIRKALQEAMGIQSSQPF